MGSVECTVGPLMSAGRCRFREPTISSHARQRGQWPIESCEQRISGSGDVGPVVTFRPRPQRVSRRESGRDEHLIRRGRRIQAKGPRPPLAPGRRTRRRHPPNGRSLNGPSDGDRVDVITRAFARSVLGSFTPTGRGGASPARRGGSNHRSRSASSGRSKAAHGSRLYRFRAPWGEVGEGRANSPKAHTMAFRLFIRAAPRLYLLGCLVLASGSR